MNKKNIILCFRHEAFFNGSQKTTFSGLGDVLKSFVYVYIFCRQNGYGFFLNFDGHILKNFLNFKKFDFGKHFKDQKAPKIVPFIKGLDLSSYIQSSSDENIFLMTGGSNISKFSYISGLREDFQEIFLSNKKIINYLNLNFPNIKSVFHARLGDGKMVSQDFLDDYYLRDFSHQFSGFDWYNSIDFDNLYPFLFKNFQEEISSSDMICSDHLCFKEFISKENEVRYIDHESVHLGVKNAQKDILNTLYDFYALFLCEKAVSISQHPFGERPSGFSYWIDKIFIKDFKYYSFDWLYKGVKPLYVY